MSKDFDVAIMGAGLVGGVLALALSQLSLRVALIEKNPLKLIPEESSDGRSLALNLGSFRLLQQLGLEEVLLSLATPIKTVQVSRQGQWGFTRFSAESMKVPALGYVVPAEHLAVLINKALLENQSICLKQASSVDEVKAKFYFIVEGAHSQTRQKLGIEVEEKNYQQSALATVIEHSHDHFNKAYERFLNEGAIALLPRGKKQSALILTASTSIIEQAAQYSDADFLDYTQNLLGYRLGKFLGVRKRFVYPLKGIFAKTLVKDNFLLVGNAAHTMHPIAAQGLNLGLAEVRLLSQLLQEGLESNWLEAYLGKQKKQQEKIVSLTNRLASAFSADFLPFHCARNVAMMALDFIPFLKRRFAKDLMGVF